MIRGTRLGALDLDAVEAGLSELGSEHLGWSRLLGAQLVRKGCVLGLHAHLGRWMELARPALELLIGPPVDGDGAVGASRLWGDPDLPADTRWPTLADCRRWEPNLDLPLDSRCRFIAQINLAELASSPAARGLPRAGLLSVFSHHEWEETGSSSICLRYFESGTELQRSPHAATSADNARLDPRLVELREALTIPECGASPFAELVGIDDDDWDTMEKHREVLIASGGGLLGLLGHDRSTTGGDPTPGREWERLITVPVDPEALVVQHLAIEQEMLRAGRLEEHQLVWVDFDGAWG